jgi:peroxiredoxin
MTKASGMPNRIRFATAAALLMLGVLFDADAARAGKFNKVLSAGDQAPDFRNVVGTDDRPHSLADWKDAKLVVVVFTCNHCPIAGAYEDRLLALAKEYREKGVQFVAVSSSRMEADSFAAMKKQAAAKKYPFPYLHDASQQVGRSYGASVTPEVFVLKADRTVGYLGTIDDNWNDAAAVSRHYLRDALDTLLAGKELLRFETRPVGCGIGYED